ncbi:hypothetical protein [Rhodobacteraceae phage LS06-2018-MD06]|nr:hypothetical protein [Rhodobacteraceae phage LS06-2018-MD06]
MKQTRRKGKSKPKRKVKNAQKESSPVHPIKVWAQLFSYGGVAESTVDSLIHEILLSLRNPEMIVRYDRISGDALISRSRSRAASKFLLNTDFDVLFMIDHDLSWQPGALQEVAYRAHKEQAIVGGLYSKRVIGKGWASRFAKNAFENMDSFRIGEPGLLPAEYVATGFMAIPRKVLIDVKDKYHDIEFVSDGADMHYWSFFSCFVDDHSLLYGKREYLSEDWAFCKRAMSLGYKCYIDKYPKLVHWGEHGFSPDDAVNVEYRQRRENVEKPVEEKAEK